MTDTLTDAPTNASDDPYPWAGTPLPPTVRSTLHILADAPVVTFDGETFPSLAIGESDALVHDGTFFLSLTGSPKQRAEFAAKLHEVADAIAAWTGR